MSVGSPDNVPPGCRLIVGDIRSLAELKAAMRGIDVVFHNAAFVSIRGSFHARRMELETNALGTLNVFETAADSNVEKVVFASSMAVYGEPRRFPVSETDSCSPISPYGLSKLRGELQGLGLAEERGLEFVALRYFNTYGVGQRQSPYVGVITTFVKQALRDEPLTVFGDGNQTRDFVSVEDVANANVLAGLSKSTGVFNIGSGIEVSINDIARMVINVLGGRTIRRDSPPGEVARIVADISKARKELHYSPEGKLEKILPKIADYQNSLLQIVPSP